MNSNIIYNKYNDFRFVFIHDKVKLDSKLPLGKELWFLHHYDLNLQLFVFILHINPKTFFYRMRKKNLFKIELKKIQRAKINNLFNLSNIDNENQLINLKLNVPKLNKRAKIKFIKNNLLKTVSNSNVEIKDLKNELNNKKEIIQKNRIFLSKLNDLSFFIKKTKKLNLIKKDKFNNKYSYRNKYKNRVKKFSRKLIFKLKNRMIVRNRIKRSSISFYLKNKINNIKFVGSPNLKNNLNLKLVLFNKYNNFNKNQNKKNQNLINNNSLIINKLNSLKDAKLNNINDIININKNKIFELEKDLAISYLKRTTLIIKKNINNNLTKDININNNSNFNFNSNYNLNIKDNNNSNLNINDNKNNNNNNNNFINNFIFNFNNNQFSIPYSLFENKQFLNFNDFTKDKLNLFFNEYLNSSIYKNLYKNLNVNNQKQRQSSFNFDSYSNNVENIKYLRKYLTTVLPFDVKKATNQYLFYQFNNANANKFLFKMEQAANLISEAFISMGCLISKVRFKQVYYKNVLISEYNLLKDNNNNNNFNNNNKSNFNLFKPNSKTAKSKLIISFFYYIQYANAFREDSNNNNNKNIFNFNINENHFGFRFRKLSKIKNIFSVFNDKLNFLSDFLTKYFGCDIEINAIRLYRAHKDSNILIQKIFIRNLKRRFRTVSNRLFRKLVVYKNNFLLDEDLKTRNSKFNYISKVAGINIKLAGRSLKENIIPRKTVKLAQRGHFQNALWVDKATLTNKSKKGAFTFTVKLNHVFKTNNKRFRF